MNNEFERIEAYQSTPVELTEDYEFKRDFGNLDFRKSKMTYVSFSIIFLFAMQGLMGDQTEILKQLNETLRLITYLFTILMLWVLVGLIYFSLYRENTLFKGVGVIRIRSIDFAWGIALLLSLFAVASGIAVLLTYFNMPPKGEIGLLLPEELLGKFVWVAVSFTAGFCEEVIFRNMLSQKNIPIHYSDRLLNNTH